MRHLLLSLLLLLSFVPCRALTVGQLRVQSAANPVGIDDETVSFSWQIASRRRATLQDAYSVTIAADPSFRNVVWQSGDVSSRDQRCIADGFRPSPCTRYWWRVSVTDNHGRHAVSREHAYFETGLMGAGWSDACWISEPTQAEGAAMFRKVIMLDAQRGIRSARLYSTALGIYNAYVNGARVGIVDDRGDVEYDELKPGFTEYSHTVFYLTHDVTALLHGGANVLGAVVTPGWWSGTIAHGLYGSHPTAFMAKLVVTYDDGSSETFVTDPSWQSSAEGPLRMGDIYNGETYDARRESAWCSVAYDATAWNPCVESHDFQGAVRAFEGPAIKVIDELERVPVEARICEGVDSTGTTFGAAHVVATLQGNDAVTLRKGQTVIWDLGQNIAGWVQFTVRGASGTDVLFRFAEILNDNGDQSRGCDGPGGSLYVANLRGAGAKLHYILRGDDRGETYHPSTTFFGFRYVEATATDDVVISGVTGQVVTSAMDERSTFATSDAAVNQLYSNIRWGQRANFISIPTDCPQRDERLGWTADTQIFSLAGMYNADLKTFYEKWMRDMRDSQREDGAYPHIAPYAWHVGHGAAVWADAGIVLPWNVFTMYGDTKIVRDNIDSMERYMQWLSTQTEEPWLYNGGATTYGDWVAFTHTDSRYISVCYYAYDALLMARMERLLGGDDREAKAVAYDSLYQSIREEYGRRYLGDDGMPVYDSQTAYLLPLRFGLFRNEADEATARQRLRAAIENNGNRLNTGFVGTGILNQTLSQQGMDDLAYTLLLQHECPSWLYSVDQGATTIWERWNSYTLDKGFGDAGMNSFNHYAYGTVGEWMFRYMAGIAPDEGDGGFAHFFLQPTPDFRTAFPEGQQRMTHAAAQYASAWGPIASGWTTDGAKTVYTFTVPAGTAATVAIPVADDASVRINRRAVSMDADGIRCKARGTADYRRADGRLLFEAASGTYKVTVAAQ